MVYYLYLLLVSLLIILVKTLSWKSTSVRFRYSLRIFQIRVWNLNHTMFFQSIFLFCYRSFSKQSNLWSLFRMFDWFSINRIQASFISALFSDEIRFKPLVKRRLHAFPIESRPIFLVRARYRIPVFSKRDPDDSIDAWFRMSSEHACFSVRLL